MSTVIAVIVLVIIIGAAVAYLVRARKKGHKCIGCPAGGSCAVKEHSQHECGCHSEK